MFEVKAIDRKYYTENLKQFIPKKIDIQTLIQKHFLQWLMAQRNVSSETIKS